MKPIAMDNRLTFLAILLFGLISVVTIDVRGESWCGGGTGWPDPPMGCDGSINPVGVTGQVCGSPGNLGQLQCEWCTYGSQACACLGCGTFTCAAPFGGPVQAGDSITAYQLSPPDACGAQTCLSQQRVCDISGTLSGTYTLQTCTPVAGSCDCAPPAGWVPNTPIPDGASITAYQTLTVACGDTCASETRTCTSGVLSGSYTNQNCTVDSCIPCGGQPATQLCPDGVTTQTLDTVSCTYSPSCPMCTTTSDDFPPLPQSINQLPYTVYLPNNDVACGGAGGTTPYNITTMPTPPGFFPAGSSIFGVSPPIAPAQIFFLPTRIHHEWQISSPVSPCINPLGGAAIPSGGSITAYQASTVACGSSCVSEVRVCTNGVLSGSYIEPTCSVSCADCTNPFGGAAIPHGSSITAYQAATVTCGNTCNSEVRNCNNGTLSGTYTHQNCTVGFCASGCGGLTCNSGEPGCFPMSSCGSGGHWVCTAPDGDGNFNCGCTGCLSGGGDPPGCQPADTPTCAPGEFPICSNGLVPGPRESCTWWCQDPYSTPLSACPAM